MFNGQERSASMQASVSGIIRLQYVLQWRKTIMRNYVILLIGLTAMLLACFGDSVVMSAYGPCSTVQPEINTNTIRCENGVCVGQMITIPIQKECEGIERTCESASNYAQMIITNPRTEVHFVYQALISAGASVACAECIELAIASGLPSGGAGGIAIATLCAYVCGKGWAMANSCLVVECYPDYTTRVEVPGWSYCY